MTKIILHGLLGKKFGEEHNFFVRKPIDSIKGLMANKKGFSKAIRTWGMKGKGYQIICDGEVMEYEKQFLKNSTKIKEIEIVPVIMGASDAFKIVVGAILIIASFFAGPFGPFLLSVGVSLVTAGVMGLLYPPPTPSFESSPQGKSFMFSGTTNSTVQGVPVPVGYGRLRVGSKVISTELKPKRLGKGGPVFGGGQRMGAPIGNDYHHWSERDWENQHQILADRLEFGFQHEQVILPEVIEDWIGD